MKLFSTLVILFFFCSINAQTSFIDSERLTKKWETEGFITPESVLYDAKRDILYVSNIGSEDPTKMDRTGFISTMKTDGSIIKLKWATGLNAPKGMAIFDGTLYVTDINRLVRINLETGKVVESFPIEGSKFLNDIVITENGTVIISDSKGPAYYKLEGNDTQKFIQDSSFHFPNGLCLEETKIVSGVGDRIISIDMQAGEWADFILETGGVDGLSKVNDNTYIISDWQGKIHLVYTDKPKELILDTGIEKINAADFYYNAKKNLLFVPTFFHNTVSCYKLNN